MTQQASSRCPFISNTGFLTKLLFGLIILLLSVTVFTPLRLNNDAVRYLLIMEYIDGKLPATSVAAHDFLPHGYPVFLLLLKRLHFLNPVGITVTNIMAIVISALLTVKIFNIQNKWAYISLVLLSFVNVKEFSLSLSDQFFTMLLMLALYTWDMFFKGKRWFIVPAILLIFISIYVRTAGAALVSGIILYSIYLNRAALFRYKILTSLFLAFGLLLLALMIFNLAWLEIHVDYVRQLNLKTIITDPLAAFWRLRIHLQEFGEISLNVPYSKLTALLTAGKYDFAEVILVVTGAGAFYAMFKQIVKLKLINSVVLWMLGSYLLMIFLWPFNDARFLTPVIPIFIYLLVGYLYGTIKNRISYYKLIPVAIYLTFGTISLIYSVALSVSKPFFLGHYGADPMLTQTYRNYFNSKQKNQIYNINDDQVSYLLQQYDSK